MTGVMVDVEHSLKMLCPTMRLCGRWVGPFKLYSYNTMILMDLSN